MGGNVEEVLSIVLKKTLKLSKVHFFVFLTKQVTWRKNTRCSFTCIAVLYLSSQMEMRLLWEFSLLKEIKERRNAPGLGLPECPNNDRWERGCKTVLEEQFGKLVVKSVVQKLHTSALICFADIVVEQRPILCFSVRLAAFEGFGKNVLSITTMEDPPRGKKAQARE